MTEITASLVKDLRERSGAGMMECKKALAEHGGDIEAAMEGLRKSGLAKADKKASRVAAEGRIVLAHDGNRAVQLYVRAAADSVLEGKAAAPQMGNRDDEFVELDAEGNPVAKEDKKGAPRRAPAPRKPGGPRRDAAPRGDKRDAR